MFTPNSKMIAISPGFGFRMVVALEELLVLEALGVEANQMVVEPVINKLLSNRHYAVRISGHRFGRGRHHGRRRWPGNSTATPGVRQLEAELQEELLGLPKIREVGGLSEEKEQLTCSSGTRIAARTCPPRVKGPEDLSMHLKAGFHHSLSP